MLFKSVVFVVLSALFGASIYSSSESIVFGKGTEPSNTACTYQNHGKVANCTVLNDDGTTTGVKCTKNKDGKTWDCSVVRATPPPPELDSALSNTVKGHLGAAPGSTNSGENNTRITNGNTVKSGGALKSNLGPETPPQSTGNDTLQ